MKLSLKTLSVTLLSLLPSADAFSSAGSSNIVLYWGQASAGSQQSLGTYCKSTDADVYVLSFLSDFPQSRLSIHGCSGSLDASCPDVAADIKLCQSLGKKVLLSLGGAAGSYGFASDQQAINFASTLWNSFGGGESTQRPFGDAIVDGFDLDIENGDPTGYAALTTALKKLYAGGEYYLAAAPQCMYPDASLSTALSNGYFDFVFIQFYNNKCEVDGSFNWATWEDYAAEYAASTNPNIRLFLGLPGSTSAASSGFVSVSTVQTVLASIKSSTYFGGIMLWDASQAVSNVVNGVSYVSSLKSLLTLGSTDTDIVADVPVSSKKSSPASSAAVANEWGAAVATATVVYNEWGNPVVVTPSSSPVANQWAAPAASSSAAVVDEWDAPVSSSVANEWAVPASSSVANEWAAPASSSVANEWAAPASSSVADTWNAPVSSIVNEWAPAAVTSVQALSVATAIVEEVVATSVVATAESPSTQWSESSVDNGLWNPNAPVNPDNGYWTTGKYENKNINKLVVAEPPTEKEQNSSAASSSSFVVSSAAPSVKISSVSSSTSSQSIVVLSSTAVSSSVTPAATFPTASSVSSAVSYSIAVSSSSSFLTDFSAVTSAVASSPVESSAVASSDSSVVLSSVAASSSSPVAVSSTSVAVELTSSSAASYAAAVESTISLVSSIATTTPQISSSSFVPRSTFYSSFTTIRSAAPVFSSSFAETFVATVTSVAPSSIETIVSVAANTIEASTSAIQSSAPVESTAASDNSLPTSKSVTRSLKIVEPESVPQKCHDNSQGHVDSCLNNLFETEIKPVELDAKDITDSDTSAALPTTGDITQVTSSLSDDKQDSDEINCTKEGAVTCKDGKFAMCNFNKWVLFNCPPSTTCKALTISSIETVVGCNFI